MRSSDSACFSCSAASPVFRSAGKYAQSTERAIRSSTQDDDSLAQLGSTALDERVVTARRYFSAECIARVPNESSGLGAELFLAQISHHTPGGIEDANFRGTASGKVE